VRKRRRSRSAIETIATRKSSPGYRPGRYRVLHPVTELGAESASRARPNEGAQLKLTSRLAPRFRNFWFDGNQAGGRAAETSTRPRFRRLWEPTNSKEVFMVDSGKYIRFRSRRLSVWHTSSRDFLRCAVSAIRVARVLRPFRGLSPGARSPFFIGSVTFTVTGLCSARPMEWRGDFGAKTTLRQCHRSSALSPL
jgi:hypothetical protein